MKFSIQHQRSRLGDDLVVGMEAEEEERISRVTITLDGFDLSDDAIDPPGVSYERQFLQTGDASLHMQHQFTVLAIDPDGKPKSADRHWQDVT